MLHQEAIEEVEKHVRAKMPAAQAEFYSSLAQALFQQFRGFKAKFSCSADFVNYFQEVSIKGLKIKQRGTDGLEEVMTFLPSLAMVLESSCFQKVDEASAKRISGKFIDQRELYLRKPLFL